MVMQTPQQIRQARENWLATVNHLVAEVTRWAKARNWAVHPDEKEIREEPFGTYAAPWLRISTPDGEVHLDPVARYVAGRAEGRVDLEAWPTLNRIMLLRKADTWTIMTDSGVPIRRRWNQRTFEQLSRDLLAQQ